MTLFSIWLERIECDAKNWTLFYSQLRLNWTAFWFTELNTSFQHESFTNMTQRFELLKIWPKDLNSWKYDPKIWTLSNMTQRFEHFLIYLFSNMTQRIELFFPIWLKELNLFSNMTQRIEPFSNMSQRFGPFWIWLKELELLEHDSKILFFEYDSKNYFDYDSKNWIFHSNSKNWPFYSYDSKNFWKYDSKNCTLF